MYVCVCMCACVCVWQTATFVFCQCVCRFVYVGMRVSVRLCICCVLCLGKAGGSVPLHAGSPRAVSHVEFTTPDSILRTANTFTFKYTHSHISLYVLVSQSILTSIYISLPINLLSIIYVSIYRISFIYLHY